MTGSGGGGVGDPRDRDAKVVLEDVRKGRVSVTAARKLYKVAVLAVAGDEAGAMIDADETERLRGRQAEGVDRA
jgi:N-methylhydantoinase B/oxoprolinase/acetone carboxylase alpha subunit